MQEDRRMLQWVSKIDYYELSQQLSSLGYQCYVHIYTEGLAFKKMSQNTSKSVPSDSYSYFICCLFVGFYNVGLVAERAVYVVCFCFSLIFHSLTFQNSWEISKRWSICMLETFHGESNRIYSRHILSFYLLSLQMLFLKSGIFQTKKKRRGNSDI